MALTLIELKNELNFQLQSVIRVTTSKELEGKDEEALWLSGVKEGLETAINFIEQGE